MKTFFRQHKIALFAILVVLCFGILTGLVIAGTIRLSMTEHAFTTVAEAKSQEHAAQPTAGTQTEPVLTPKPTNGLSLSFHTTTVDGCFDIEFAIKRQYTKRLHNNVLQGVNREILLVILAVNCYVACSLAQVNACDSGLSASNCINYFHFT